MAEVLRRLGANFFLLFPDDRANTTLNSSTPGADGIATTNFEAMLLRDGEVVATNLAALLAGPFNLTIDNVSGQFGVYKVNLTLDTRGFYDLFIRHTTDMVTTRSAHFDLVTRPEILSLSQGNTRYDFTLALADIPARQVAQGVLSTVRVRQRYDGAADFSAGNLVLDQTYELYYDNLGDTNPNAVVPT